MYNFWDTFKIAQLSKEVPYFPVFKRPVWFSGKWYALKVHTDIKSHTSMYKRHTILKAKNGQKGGLLYTGKCDK